MYDENNITYRVGINWKDILVKIIMLILFILLLLWIFPKADLDVFYDQVYTNNIKTMKEAARNYYTVDRLPKSVGDQTSMTLKEMVDNKMIIRFTDKDGKTCDESSSGIEITKTSDNEYTMKVELNCGDQKDYILETIGCTTVCSNGTCQTIINNGNNSSNIVADGSSNNGYNNGTGSTNNSDTVQDNTDWESMTGSSKDDVYKIKVTYYQHKKAVTTTKTVYTCPDGYTKNGTKCTKKTTGATIDATPVYNPDTVETTDAKFNYNGSYTIYADPIKTKVDTDISCPTGYTLNGAYCIKYTDATEVKGETTYTCPSGYTKNGTKCTKSYDATYKAGATTYTCPNGGTLNGTKCVLTTTATSNTEYTCPSGYTKNGTSCYKVYTATSKTSYTCPNGGSLSGTKCVTSSSYNATASTVYGSWVSQGTKYYTSAGQAYTGDTSKLVYVGKITGAACGSPCGNSGIWYKYTYYTRSKTTKYTCPNGGSLSGTKCVTSSSYNATANTTYTCPNGGTQSGGKCTLTANATANTTYTCPSGYTRNGTTCTKTYDATANTGAGSYTCPNGGTLNGSKCIVTIDATPTTGATTYSCPTGYTYNETLKKCEYKITATITDVYEYSCPTGYTKSGEGEKTICSKTTQGEKVYYCENANAVLNGTKCILTIKGGIKNYTCPTGYTLNGTKCTKNSVVTIDATATTKKSTTYKYKWSKSSQLDGWTFTGKTKVVEETYTAGQK
ncbi:MAG: hypothetical protein ACI4XM_03565 [Candidatus Coprovivens sp.]